MPYRVHVFNGTTHVLKNSLATNSLSNAASEVFKALMVPLMCAWCSSHLGCNYFNLENRRCESCNESSGCFLRKEIPDLNEEELKTMDASHGVCPECFKKAIEE